ncbi:hypothetical protein KCMC57_up08190 [Kitasatospora sp. CMC57]|uniref:Uncharacterized protein n=1 Tax=Kitasatospora sp. CMC57 TaxID=3231513 RepID=A0AB33JNK8_9ACTN
MPVAVRVCAVESSFVTVTVAPGLTVNVSGPKVNSLMETRTSAAGELAAADADADGLAADGDADDGDGDTADCDAAGVGVPEAGPPPEEPLEQPATVRASRRAPRAGRSRGESTTGPFQKGARRGHGGDHRTLTSFRPHRVTPGSPDAPGHPHGRAGSPVRPCRRSSEDGSDRRGTAEHPCGAVSTERQVPWPKLPSTHLRSQCMTPSRTYSRAGAALGAAL